MTQYLTDNWRLRPIPPPRSLLPPPFRLSYFANSCQEFRLCWSFQSGQTVEFVHSGHALSYTKLVHRHVTQTEGNKYFKWGVWQLFLKYFFVLATHVDSLWLRSCLLCSINCECDNVRNTLVFLIPFTTSSLISVSPFPRPFLCLPCVCLGRRVAEWLERRIWNPYVTDSNLLLTASWCCSRQPRVQLLGCTCK